MPTKIGDQNFVNVDPEIPKCEIKTFDFPLKCSNKSSKIVDFEIPNFEEKSLITHKK